MDTHLLTLEDEKKNIPRSLKGNVWSQAPFLAQISQGCPLVSLWSYCRSDAQAGGF